jgi:CheY-like chemotaxis protein
MGIFSAAIALFGPGGVGRYERLPNPPCQQEAETKSTILVIDDDPMVLQIVKSVLGKEGYNVLASASAPKGLDTIRYVGGDVRLVLLDYKMPRLAGDETLAFVKRLSPSTRVIGITAMDINTVPGEFLDGVDKLLLKPLVAAELIKTVHDLLGDRPVASVAATLP